MKLFELNNQRVKLPLGMKEQLIETAGFVITAPQGKQTNYRLKFPEDEVWGKRAGKEYLAGANESSVVEHAWWELVMSQAEYMHAVVVTQQGGSSREWYPNLHSTMRGGYAAQVRHREATYDATEPSMVKMPLFNWSGKDPKDRHNGGFALVELVDEQVTCATGI